jgi:hypothetical protein
MTARIGHLGQDNRGRTARTGQPEQDSRGRTASVERPGQERQIRRGGTGEQGLVSLNKPAETGNSLQDRDDRTSSNITLRS